MGSNPISHPIPPSPGPSADLSPDAICWAYRLLLGRDPTLEDIAGAARFGTRERLAYQLLFVDSEFRAGKYGQRVAATGSQVASREGPMRRLFGRETAPAQVTREAVLWAYRLFLSREPESTWVVDEKLKAADSVELAQSFFHSQEFAAISSDWRQDFANEETEGLPLPPLKLRRSVGKEDRAHWDLPAGRLAFGDEVPVDAYRAVFDFGCGCGRTARQLLQQAPPSESYCGVDLHPRSIAWCQAFLTPMAPEFKFFHLDVYNRWFNPGGARADAAFPVETTFTLVNAHSVFTHIVAESIDHYLSECARVLEPGGTFRATWFLFDKTAFPMMQESQNALYINVEDPTNAVIYDYRFVEARYRAHGLVLTRIAAPAVQGFHWVLIATQARQGLEAAPFPADVADKGVVSPPTR